MDERWNRWGGVVAEAGRLAVLIILLGSLRSAVADWNQVPTGSMKPTILEGDRIWVNKLAYDLKVPFTTVRLARWAEPKRGDIVVFFHPEDGTRLVKRVVGLPGDQIVLMDNHLIVNGEPALYAPIDPEKIDALTDTSILGHDVAMESVGVAHYPVMTRQGDSPAGNFGPAVVPAEQYFAMGDNRDNSADSRVFGFVPRDLIVGRATSVVLSVDPRDTWTVRWRRFFSALP